MNDESGGIIILAFYFIVGTICILFKLFGVVDFSWWVILLPMYAPIIAAVLGVTIIAAYVTIKDRNND